VLIVTTLVVLVVLVVLLISVPWRLRDRGVVVGEVPLILADLPAQYRTGGHVLPFFMPRHAVLLLGL